LQKISVTEDRAWLIRFLVSKKRGRACFYPARFLRRGPGDKSELSNI